MKYLLKHGHLIIDGNNEYLDGALLIDGERIKEVYYQSNKLDDIDDEYQVIDLKGAIVMPGFFDTHTHGIDSITFDVCTKEELDKLCYEFARDGSTSFLGSISYDLPTNKYDGRWEVFNGYESEWNRFMGIHIEGPFLSPKHLGVGDPEKFLKPDVNLYKDVLSKTDVLKQVTVAYEREGAKEIGKFLHDNNVRVMCGHSDALEADLDENVDGFTHLFNAMRGLHHRDITLVNAAFTGKYYCEIITDGNHVSENVLKLVMNNIDRNKIVIVTDSSEARGLADGEYISFSKHCIKKGTKYMTVDGHYAGSVVSINDEIKELRKLGAKYTDLLLWSSLNAFKLYGLDQQFGTLVKGKYADLVIMDDELNIKNVYSKGKFIYD